MQGKRINPYYMAQDILSRRDHSEHELRVKLQRKHFSPAQISDVVEKLKEKHLIDDERFAAAYVESSLRTKPVGPRWLMQKLSMKGLSREVSSRILAEALPPERLETLKQEARERWVRLHPKHADDRIRLQRFLISRGF